MQKFKIRVRQPDGHDPVELPDTVLAENAVDALNRARSIVESQPNPPATSDLYVVQVLED